jgi:hypothetical protein
LLRAAQAHLTVELWDPGADHAVGGSGPNSDLLITSMMTGALGQYHFANLQPDYYYVRVLPPTNLRIQGANPVDADNSTDRDNNGVSQPGGDEIENYPRKPFMVDPRRNGGCEGEWILKWNVIQREREAAHRDASEEVRVRRR